MAFGHNNTGPVFVLELEINTHKQKDYQFFQHRENTAVSVYDDCLGEALKRLHKLQHSWIYKYACGQYSYHAQMVESLEAKIDKLEKERTKAGKPGLVPKQLREDLKQAREDLKEHKALKSISGKAIEDVKDYYGYSAGDMDTYVKIPKHYFDTLGIDECQKLVERAFAAVEKIRTGKAKRVNFVKREDGITIEGKSNRSTLRFDNTTKQLLFGKGHAFELIVKKKDLYAQEALTHHCRYVRVIRKDIRGRVRYFAQLIMEGYPPKKNRQVGRKDVSVGLDEGVSTLGISNKKYVGLQELAPSVKNNEAEIRRLQRAMDRSRRATNPGNYNEDGSIKKGHKTWVKSNNYRKLQSRLKDQYRKLAAKRKQDHEILANNLIALGRNIKVETMQMKALAKRARKTTINKSNGKNNRKSRYGKVIAMRAPAMLIDIIDRKLKYYGSMIIKIDTRAVKASQLNHEDGTYQKKALNQRSSVIEGKPVQREMYSAFVIEHVEPDGSTVDLKQCHRDFKEFSKRHDAAVSRIRQSDSKHIKWYIHDLPANA